MITRPYNFACTVPPARMQQMFREGQMQKMILSSTVGSFSESIERVQTVHRYVHLANQIDRAQSLHQCYAAHGIAWGWMAPAWPRLTVVWSISRNTCAYS